MKIVFICILTINFREAYFESAKHQMSKTTFTQFGHEIVLSCVPIEGGLDKMMKEIYFLTIVKFYANVSY